MNRVIYGLSGQAGSGKDSFADVLVEHKGFRKLSYAGPLKYICAKVFKLTYNDINTQEGKMTIFKTPKKLDETAFKAIIEEVGKLYATERHILGLSVLSKELLPQNIEFKRPRDILQYVGTEIIRSVDKNYFIDVMSNELKNSTDNVVVVDCRFPNERELIKKAGGKTIRIKRFDNPIDAGSHATETSFGEDEEYDFVINNNGTLQDFIETVRGGF